MRCALQFCVQRRLVCATWWVANWCLARPVAHHGLVCVSLIFHCWWFSFFCICARVLLCLGLWQVYLRLCFSFSLFLFVDIWWYVFHLCWIAERRFEVYLLLFFFFEFWFLCVSDGYRISAFGIYCQVFIAFCCFRILSLSLKFVDISLTRLFVLFLVLVAFTATCWPCRFDRDFHCVFLTVFSILPWLRPCFDYF